MEEKKHIYFLVGIKLPQDDPRIVEESMRELEGLVKTAGGDVAGSVIQNRKAIDATYYIGKGKLEEIDFLFDKTEDQEAAVVFNMSLSPSQARNIEEILECRVITRTQLILDIFAIHAHSQIAKLQVETAQLSYMLPRLMGQGASMSRSGGGIGTRGPGETKLETDRRKINNRILILKKELKQLENSSEEKRKSRQFVFKVAIAGYTNAGKSSLATILVGDQLLAENKLFSTVDTTTRQLKLGGIPAVLTDTVGFIRDIPHEIVESFKSTLAETANADLVLHAVDASSDFYIEKIQTAQDLMDEMDIKSPIQLVFNKIDLLETEYLVNLKVNYPDAIFLSAKNEDGVGVLKELLQKEAIQFLKNNGQEIPAWMNY